jgi:ABC-type amino acid transport substrate-binding protein
MKLSILMTAVLLTAGLATTAGAQTPSTLKKIADSNKITVSYREASVPFSYLIGSKTSIGFSAELTEAIIDDVRKKLKKPNLEVAYMPVTSQNRIPLLVNGTYDIECGSTTNNTARGKDVAFRDQPLLHRHAPAGQKIVRHQELRRPGQKDGCQHHRHHQRAGDPQVQRRQETRHAAHPG